MINTEVEPKYFYFTQASKFSNIYQFKYYLSEISFNYLERIEKSSPKYMEINNPASASWITIHVKSLELTNLNEIKLMLRFYFVHWLHIASEDYV